MTEIERRNEPPSGGVYDLPVVGRGFRETREFFDEMRPTPDDSAGVVLGKQVVRYSAVAGATAAGLATGCLLVL